MILFDNNIEILFDNKILAMVAVSSIAILFGIFPFFIFIFFWFLSKLENSVLVSRLSISRFDMNIRDK